MDEIACDSAHILGGPVCFCPFVVDTQIGVFLGRYCSFLLIVHTKHLCDVEQRAVVAETLVFELDRHVWGAVWGA